MLVANFLVKLESLFICLLSISILLVILFVYGLQHFKCYLFIYFIIIKKSSLTNNKLS